MLRFVALLTAAVGAYEASAQVNGKGVFQIGLGANMGFHATDFTWSATLPLLGKVSKSEQDGAVTVAWPLEFQGGLSDRFSLGLGLEPGSYIDSSGARTNGFVVLGIQPRYYVVNGERAALHLNMDLGAGALRIDEVKSGARTYDDAYVGGHFRLGAGFQYYFGRVFGLNLGIKYAAHNLRWRDRDPEDPLLKNLDYEARLRTSGLLVQLGMQVRL